MAAAGWVPEGNGPDGVFACVPPGGTSPGSAFQQEVTGYADLMLGLVNGEVVNTDQLSLILSSALNALTTPGSTCPVATSTPPLANLTAIPPSLTINISYGNGCSVPGGGGTLAGSAVLSLNNLVVTDNSLSGSLSATFNDVRVNGSPVANGTIQATANLLINSATEAITGTVTINFNAFQLPEFGLTGSIGINLNTTGTTTVTTNLTTSPHNIAIKVNLAIVDQATGGVLVNSTGASTVGAYSVQVSNIRIDADVCTTGAIGGTISFTKSGQTGTLTFNSSCQYTYSGP
jgi:hypothetical protein